MSCILCDYHDKTPGDDGTPNNVNKTCKGCENEFCLPCYWHHSCRYHQKEIEFCGECNTEIDLGLNPHPFKDEEADIFVCAKCLQKRVVKPN